MKKIILLFALLLSGLSFAQQLNSYKYVIVPERFEFQSLDNQYNLNALTKMAFEKYGFTVFFAKDKLPDELALDRCKALYADIKNDSGILGTAIILSLKDCRGAGVFTSKRGKSKEKTYKAAYYEALRQASESLGELHYNYTPKAVAAHQSAAVVNEIKTSTGQLTAKPITNGYELLDASQKQVLKMYKTSQAESYSAQAEGKSGVVFKKGGDWYFEYYQNDKLVSEKLDIKF